MTPGKWEDGEERSGHSHGVVVILPWRSQLADLSELIKRSGYRDRRTNDGQQVTRASYPTRSVSDARRAST